MNEHATETADQSYFPLVVRFSDTGEELAFDEPRYIPSGRPFVVLSHSGPECQEPPL